MAPMQPGMVWIGWITLAALLQFLLITIYAARMRDKYRVPAPAITGNPDFERSLRVQANTLEQLVPFLAALWLCAVFWAPFPAAVLGIIWLFGRTLYAFGYYRAAGQRMPGFIIAMLALVGLMIGAAFGLFRMGVVLGSF